MSKIKKIIACIGIFVGVYFGSFAVIMLAGNLSPTIMFKMDFGYPVLAFVMLASSLFTFLCGSKLNKLFGRTLLFSLLFVYTIIPIIMLVCSNLCDTSSVLLILTYWIDLPFVCIAMIGGELAGAGMASIFYILITPLPALLTYLITYKTYHKKQLLKQKTQP